MRPSRRDCAAARIASYAMLSSAVCFALAVSALALAWHFDIPYVDDWRLLDEMHRMPLLAWLFSSQNGHRLPVTLLLLYLDQTFASGRMHLLVLAMLAAAWISVGIAAVALKRSCGGSPALRRTLIAFTTFVLFLSGSAFNFHWGTNHGSVWTAMWLFVALFAFDAARARMGSRAGPRLVALSAASALVAVFGHGIGVATWASLLAMCAIARMPWRTAVVLGASALASLVLHRLGPSGLAPGANPGAILTVLAANPGGVLVFVCALVGAPIAWMLRGLDLVAASSYLSVSRAVGAVALLGTVAVLMLAWRKGRTLPTVSLMGIGLMVFVLAGAVLIASVRLGSLGPSDAVSPRFLCWSLLFWIGGAWALAGSAERRAARAALASLLGALAIAMLPAMTDVRASHRDRLENAANTALVLLLDHHPGGMVDFPGPMSKQRLELIGRVTKRLAETRRSPFDDARYGLGGSRFEERFTPSDQRSCGRLLKVRWRSPDGRLVAIEGDLDPEASRATTIVAADSQGVVRGLGEERPLLGIAARDRRWAAMLAGVVPGERYSVWALLPDGRTACALGSIKSPPRLSAIELLPAPARGASAVER